MPATVDDPSPVHTYSHFGRNPELLMRLERCTPLQKKPDGFILSPLGPLGKVPKNVVARGLLMNEVQSLELSAPEDFAGVQQDGHGAFVDQLDAHHFLETAGFAAQASRLNFPDEQIVHPPGVLARGGCVE